MQTSVQDKDKWSANADNYAKATKSSHLSSAPTVEMLFAQMNIAQPFSAATAILDVGTGPGVTIRRLIESYGAQIPASTRLIASDFSAGMIEQVQKLKQQEQDNNPIWSRVEAKVLDAQVLDGVEDASISHITGTMVYNLVSDGRQALEAAHRVLQPGGIVGMTLGSQAEWMDLMDLAAKSIRGPTSPTFHFPTGYGTLLGIQDEFKEVGFKAEYVESMEFSMDISDPKPIVENFLRAKNPGALFFVEDYSDEELNAFVSEFLRLAEERHPELPRKLTGVLIVAVGKKLG